MATGDLVANEESLVRALWHPYYDESKDRVSPSAFAQMDVSVSREAVLPYEAIVDIFKADFNGTGKDASRRVNATATVLAGCVLEACSENKDVAVTIIEDPLPNDPTPNIAHALIRARKATAPHELREITKGMANRILKAITVRKVE